MNRDERIARIWHKRLTREFCDGHSYNSLCWEYGKGFHDGPAWHQTGHLKCPCSRYGSDGDECAWWAIAMAFVYEEANGDGFDPDGMEHFMSLAVNDHDDLAELVLDHWYAIPRFLKRYIGTKAEVRGLT